MWDVFISHASEDKPKVVEPLARMLEAQGLSVWYDKMVLTLGDSLRRKIDEGLAGSRYGVVILSRNFFVKNWPQKELDALVAKESDGRKVILPVWHDIAQEEILHYSPLLADRLSVSTQAGLQNVADEIVRAVRFQAQNSVTDAGSQTLAAGQLHVAAAANLRELASRISVLDPSNSRGNVKAFRVQAFAEPPDVRDYAGRLLKDRLGFVATEEGASVAVRRLRQEIFGAIKALIPTALGSCFGDGEFEGMDLYGFDFSGANMQKASFRGAFLVEADFTGATLDGTDFTSSCLRNANFSDALLTSANLTDADWFNAVGFNESQLTSARRDTVQSCPGSVNALESYIRAKYKFPMENWDPRLKSQLRSTWQQYLGPYGVCSAVSRWRSEVEILEAGRPPTKPTGQQPKTYAGISPREATTASKESAEFRQQLLQHPSIQRLMNNANWRDAAVAAVEYWLHGTPSPVAGWENTRTWDIVKAVYDELVRSG